MPSGGFTRSTRNTYVKAYLILMTEAVCRWLLTTGDALPGARPYVAPRTLRDTRSTCAS